jgi:hypothetical protein
MLSPNNFKLKLIIILGKIEHIYSMIEIKTIKEDKILFGDQTLKVC